MDTKNLTEVFVSVYLIIFGLSHSLIVHPLVRSDNNFSGLCSINRAKSIRWPFEIDTNWPIEGRCGGCWEVDLSRYLFLTTSRSSTTTHTVHAKWIVHANVESDRCSWNSSVITEKSEKRGAAQPYEAFWLSALAATGGVLVYSQINEKTKVRLIKS